MSQPCGKAAKKKKAWRHSRVKNPWMHIPCRYSCVNQSCNCLQVPPHWLIGTPPGLSKETTEAWSPAKDLALSCWEKKNLWDRDLPMKKWWKPRENLLIIWEEVMERCLGKEEGWTLRKSVFYLKAYTCMYVCMHDENKMMRGEWDNSNYVFDLRTESKWEKGGVCSYVFSICFAMNILKAIKCNESLDSLYCFCWTNLTNTVLDARIGSFSEFFHHSKQIIVFFLPQYSKDRCEGTQNWAACFVYSAKTYK